MGSGTDAGFTQPKINTIKLLLGRVPLDVLCEMLDCTKPALGWQIKKLEPDGLKRPSKRCTLHKFVWSYRQESFFDLDEADQRMLRACWLAHLREFGRKLSSLKLAQDDHSPVEVIEHCWERVPGVVLRRLLGLTPKTFDKIRRALALTRTAAETRALTVKYYSAEWNTFGLEMSNAQTKRLAAIVAEDRKGSVAAWDQRFAQRRAARLASMLRARGGQGKRLFKCKGAYCNERWPRAETFFYRSLDFASGFKDVCKYCHYCEAHEPKPARVTRGPVNHVSAAATSALVPLVREMNASVPTRYLRKVFMLSERQLERVRKLAGVWNEHGENQIKLLAWRAADEQTVPVFANLPEGLRLRLREIWKADQQEWKLSFAMADQALVAVLEADAKRVAASIKRVRCKDCGRFFPEEEFFFPKNAGKGHCRCCYLPLVRAQAHELVAPRFFERLFESAAFLM